jgi:2,3-bisphosphoglycerate-independent phosphoglycerate mutase
MKNKTPTQVVLIILDGWGHREEKENNAIAEARTPFFDWLWNEYPHTLLDASQEAVGLPAGTIGNSEIGHMTMGAGKVIDTDLIKISKAVHNNQLADNPSLKKLFLHVKKYSSTLHILGMVSQAGVHSHQEHLHGFLKAAKQSGLEKVVIHAFTDGRDSPPQKNHKYLEELENVISDLGIGYIATATGRYFAMDRDNNWNRTEKAEKALFEVKGKAYINQKPSEVIKELYKGGALDEYLEPLIFLDQNGKGYPIENNDGIFFFNFRTDRPRQLSYKIMERAKKQNLFFVTMTEYDPKIECLVAFPPEKPDTTLAAEISKAGLRQAHIAETEKYGHVTFFFNGGKQTPHENEKHFLIESRKDVPTHDLAPEMKAIEIADKAIECINEGTNFIVMNFANADIVGHTANKPAIIKAVEIVDRELKKIYERAAQKNALIIVTADHGNAELNIHPETEEKHTAHTTNMVPFILIDSLKVKSYKLKADKASLADIAPTILQLMELPQPKGMTGKSLIVS